ncbi:hypothetical protein F2I39_08955 [Escherichia coli]|nr:hypothetical protein [Escherichia coli]
MFCYFLLTHKTIFIIHNVTLIMRLNVNQVVVVYPFPESVINSAFLRVYRPSVFLFLERTHEKKPDFSGLSQIVFRMRSMVSAS